AYIGQLSGIQLKLFLRSAMTHLTRPGSSPYDPIQSSRILDDIPPDVGRNTRDFFEIATKAGLIDQDNVRFVASALLMDHYLPDMPLFRKFYRPKMLEAIIPVSLVDLIEFELMDEFIHLRESDIPSLEIRKRLGGTALPAMRPSTV
ncbi:hypothetical protein F66182_11853, partial [Fusarium sp. NRRL 66182]